MLYVRGDQEDYDAWERRGNPGWAWQDVLPFFKAPLSDAFLSAGRRQGFPVRDINTGNATGFTFMQANIKRGKRQSTAKAFLRPSLRQGKPLTVLTEATVDRLVWGGGQSPKAVGVVYK